MSAFNIFNATPPSRGDKNDSVNATEKKNDEDVMIVTCSDDSKRATIRARNLAEELVKRSVKANTRIEQVEIMLKSYAKESLAEFMVDPDGKEFCEQIDAVVSTVVDSYDDILKYFVEECVHASASAETMD